MMTRREFRDVRPRVHRVQIKDETANSDYMNKEEEEE